MTICAATTATICWTAALGNDTLLGGLGNDIYIIGIRNRRRHRSSPARVPTSPFLLPTSISAPAQFASIESLRLTGSAQYRRHRQRSGQRHHRKRRHNGLDGGIGNDTLGRRHGQRLYRRRRRRLTSPMAEKATISTSSTARSTKSRKTRTRASTPSRHRRRATFSARNSSKASPFEDIAGAAVGTGNELAKLRTRQHQRQQAHGLAGDDFILGTAATTPSPAAPATITSKAAPVSTF